MSASYPEPEELKGVVRGTLLYLSLYLFGFIQFQSYSKFYLLAQKKREAKGKKDGAAVSFRAIKYYNSRDRLALTGDRTVGNFVEFAIMFLPLLWMHAVFVDPTQSWNLALLYTSSRSLYPVLMMYQPTWILISTGPGYLVLLYLMWQIATKFAFA